MEIVRDAYEYFYLHDASEMCWDTKLQLKPYDPEIYPEIPEKFIFNCVKNYCWIIEKFFKEINVLDITIDEGSNFYEVFNVLRYLKVLLFNNN